MRALLLALLLLSGCGGGGSSSSVPASAPPPAPTTTTPTFVDFFPHLQGKTGSATAVWRANGLVLSTYTFGPFYAQWGQSIERWAIAKCNGADWAVVLAYEQAGGLSWEASSDQTLYDGVPIVCDRGAAYAPVAMTPGTHTLKQWGQIAHERRYFWQTEFVLGGPPQTNWCWQGAGERTRPVLAQREVWQDEGGATTRGTVIGDPWANGRFLEPQVVYSFQVYAGLGAGTLWTGTDPAVGEYCLQSVTLL